MFRTILAASDGAQKGRAAVALAAQLAAAQDARLVLMTAYAPPPVPTPRELGAGSVRKQAETAIRRLRDELAPQADVRVVAASGATRAVRHAAEAEHADLVVVGSSRRAGHRALDPDHAIAVLHGATQAIAIVPDGIAVPERLTRIAVGVDGTPEGDAALAAACDLARDLNAALRICFVVDDHVPGPAASWAAAGGGVSPTALLASRSERAETVLRGAMAAAAGIDASTDVLVGVPADLADVAADLIVVGSSGRGAVRRLAFGSTADALARRATIPVLVVPRAATEHATGEEAT